MSKYTAILRPSIDPNPLGPPCVKVDVYDFLLAFGVTCPARQHAIKKILFAGKRGAKSESLDLSEAIESLRRAKELVTE